MSSRRGKAATLKTLKQTDVMSPESGQAPASSSGGPSGSSSSATGTAAAAAAAPALPPAASASGTVPDAAMEVLSVQGGASKVYQDDGIKRTSGWLEIVWHSITAMIGAGVLGLPATFAHLGWAGGCAFLAFSLWVSWHTYVLLVRMHEQPDLSGKGVRRLDRYDQLAEYVLGRRKGRAVLLPFQLAVLVGIAVTYTVVGGDNLAAFAAALAPGRALPLGKWFYYCLFGALQLVLSLLPSFDDLRWVSFLGAAMSALYCAIAVGMSATVAPGAGVSYDPAGVPRSAPARVFGVLNALSSIFFAFGGHNISLETQATIAVDQGDGRGAGLPASSVPPMLRGVHVTFLVTGVCYFAVAIAGFHAFGVGVGDNVLAAFEYGPRHAIVSAANLMVVVHVAAAFQVYTQPVFSLVEGRLAQRRQQAGGGGGCCAAPAPSRALITVLRLAYTCGVTFVALLVPFFGALMGLIGAVGITPTTFTLPPLLWLLLTRPARWSRPWLVNWALVWLTAAIGVLGAVGAVYTIAASWQSFRLFAG